MSKNIHYVLFCIIIATSFTGCDHKNTSEYKDKYLRLITNYKQIITSENKKNEYIKNIHIPKVIKFLKSSIEKIKLDRLMNLKSKIEIVHPGFIVFNRLGYVYKNNDYWFTGVASDEENTFSGSFLISENGIKIIRFNDVFSNYPDKTDKIKINDELIDIIYDQENPNKATYKYQNKLYILFENNELSNSARLGPIISEKILFDKNVSVEFYDRSFSIDRYFYIFDREKQEIVKRIILPATNYYSTQTTPYGFMSTLDLKNRIYLYLNFDAIRVEKEDERLDLSLKELSIFIYDIEKDILYDLRHKTSDIENNREIVAFTYVLGEDENIYYQIVTEKAYYVYKITPLWNEPMEETEYNPIFFEFRPKLKAAWDAMDAAEKKSADGLKQ